MHERQAFILIYMNAPIMETEKFCDGVELEI